MDSALRKQSDVVKSEIATFFDVFPQGTIWDNGIGYDLVLLGHRRGHDRRRPHAAPARSGDHALAVESLRSVRFGSAAIPGHLCRSRVRSGALADACRAKRGPQPPASIYRRGLGLNTRQQQQIYNQIMAFSRFPEDLFAASDQTRSQLRTSLEMKDLLRKSLAQRRAKTQDEN